MSLTREQKKDLKQLSEFLKKAERLNIDDNIDLDVYMTEYNRNGFSIYSTEKIGINSNAEERKKVFENLNKEKSKSKADNT